MISKDVIQTIIETARVEEVISDFVSLKKRGSNHVGLCPFHNEKTPSFSVSPTKGIYKCFGCGKSGNAVNFVMEHEHYTYPEALKYLAKKYNIEVEEEEPTPEYLQEQSEKESLYNINHFAQNYFTDILHKHEEGKAVALTYLREREFNDDTIAKFQIGYCLEGWKDFTEFALKNGYDLKILFKSGLTIERETGDHYDRFRGRIIFPILNLTGRVLGFGGRILKNDSSKPKYVNSPETDIYVKSKVLYGLNLSKNAIISADNCYVVEGYFDLISLYQNGVQNVVASLGTSLTTDQIRLIRRYTNNISILFDGDEAGLKASFRSIDLILEQGMNVRVVLFPEGEDPDSFARKHRPAEIKTYLSERGQDFIRLKTGLLLEEVKNDPVKKAALIRDVVGSISLIPDIITRSLYIKECATLMFVDEKTLIHELNKNLRNKYKRETSGTEYPEADLFQEEISTQQPLDLKSDNSEYQETEIIRLLLVFGNQEIEFENIDEYGKSEPYTVRVTDFIINDFNHDEITFDNPVYQAIFNEIVHSAAESNSILDYLHFTSHPNKEIAKIAVELVSTRYELSENWKKNKIYVNGEEKQLKRVITEGILSLKEKRIKKQIKETQLKLKEAEEASEQLNLMNLYKVQKEILDTINKQLGRVITT